VSQSHSRVFVVGAGFAGLEAARALADAPVAVTVVDRRFLALSHRLGLQVHVWTIDDPAEMHRLLDLGVDGIMTDRPEVLRDVYESRGLWPQHN